MDWKYQLRLNKVNTNSITNELIIKMSENLIESITTLIAQITNDISLSGNTKSRLNNQLSPLIDNFSQLMESCKIEEETNLLILSFNEVMNELYNIADQKIVSITSVKYKFLWIPEFME